MKPSLAAVLLTAGFLGPAGPVIAHGGPHAPVAHAVSDQPCGWQGGALPAPADTQKCLAERFNAAAGEPKPPKARTAPSGPPTNASTNAD